MVDGQHFAFAVGDNVGGNFGTIEHGHFTHAFTRPKNCKQDKVREIEVDTQPPECDEVDVITLFSRR